MNFFGRFSLGFEINQFATSIFNLNSINKIQTKYSKIASIMREINHSSLHMIYFLADTKDGEGN